MRNQLLETVDNDPWGRPYKLVMGKLKKTGIPITEGMEKEELEQILDVLFPGKEPSNGGTMKTGIGSNDDTEWREEYEITGAEIRRAVKSIRNRNAAPGPDGLSLKIWVPALDVIGDQVCKIS